MPALPSPTAAAASQQSSSNYPPCTHTTNAAKCACCRVWIEWTEERQRQHTNSNSNASTSAASTSLPQWDQCVFEGENTDCPLLTHQEQQQQQQQQQQSSLRSSSAAGGNGGDSDALLTAASASHVHSATCSHHFHIGGHGSTGDDDAILLDQDDNALQQSGNWPMLGSPYIASQSGGGLNGGGGSSSTSGAPISICTNSSCIPTLNLSDGHPSAHSSHQSHHHLHSLLHHSHASSSDQVSPDSQPHFHVHCTEELMLAEKDELTRLQHVHTAACRPQIHYQFSTDNHTVLHDHTVPLLLDSPTPSAQLSASPPPVSLQQEPMQISGGGSNNNGAAVKTEVTGKASAKSATSSSKALQMAPSMPLLPCSRVHTFPPALRFHPYHGTTGATAKSTNGVASTTAVNGASAASSTSDVVPASGAVNCHQCKVRKPVSTVIQCTAVFELTVRRSKPLCCIQKKKCAKRYCRTCLQKHYGVKLETLEKANWVCPGCLGHCTCASCTNKARQQPWPLIDTSANNTEMSTTHTHHQHGPAVTTTTMTNTMTTKGAQQQQQQQQQQQTSTTPHSAASIAAAAAAAQAVSSHSVTTGNHSTQQQTTKFMPVEPAMLTMMM